MSNPPPPRSRNFSCLINLQPTGAAKLIVTGEIETPSSTEIPHLALNPAERHPDETLELDLTIRNSGGIGTQAFNFKTTRFELSDEPERFQRVLILWQNRVLLRLNINTTP